MAESAFGVTKVNGFTATGFESLTSNFEFLTITTAIPIFTFNQVIVTTLSTTVSAATPNQLAQARASQAALDKLIQIVALRGQPVIMGVIAINTTYSVIMAVEHQYAWQSTMTSTVGGVPVGAGSYPFNDPRSSTETLLARIVADGINYGFGANVAVTYNDPISGGTYTATVNDTSALAVAYSSVLT